MLTNTIAGATPAQKTAAMAEAMRRLGENCTRQTLKVLIGCTETDMDLYGDDARAQAMARSEVQTRVRVPAAKAA